MEEEIATVFGEMLVTTEPDEAEVYLNGVNKGTSPILLSKVPVGMVRIEARKGNLIGSRTVEVSGKDTIEVNIRLEVILGKLFIKSNEKEVSVYLDENFLGPLGNGFFKDITVGEHRVALK